MMTCKGTCTRYKADRPIDTGRYQVGQKRCSVCNVFMYWEGNHCPCCNFMLRTKPKGTQTRQKLMIVQQIKRI